MKPARWLLRDQTLTCRAGVAAAPNLGGRAAEWSRAGCGSYFQIEGFVRVGDRISSSKSLGLSAFCRGCSLSSNVCHQTTRMIPRAGEPVAVLTASEYTRTCAMYLSDVASNSRSVLKSMTVQPTK